MSEYLIDKIREAQFKTEPYAHLYITQFLSDDHFKAIVSSDEINISPQANDHELFRELISKGYKIIAFPGCITNQEEYVRWHKEKTSANGRNHSTCEGFGMTLRLAQPKTEIITELKAFLEGGPFNIALSEKFGLTRDEVRADCGIQQYLDGYEISPHPDVRAKALTYMVNINPHPNSEALDHHTRYMKFKKRYNYVREFWNGNPDLDTFWVPWTWCDTVSQQTDNNSAVIFAPENDTLHAVKASYDHLKGQRTQLYGNLWYKERNHGLRQLDWSALDVMKNADRAEKRTILSRATAFIPRRLKDAIKSKLR